MKETLIAVYERESTLWKNANGFYHAQDWTKMECKTFDFSEEIDSISRDNMSKLETDGRTRKIRRLNRSKKSIAISSESFSQKLQQ